MCFGTPTIVASQAMEFQIDADRVEFTTRKIVGMIGLVDIRHRIRPGTDT